MWSTFIYNYLLCSTFFYIHLTSGTLHVGDEIKEINGIGVPMCSAERLQQILVGDVFIIYGILFLCP